MRWRVFKAEARSARRLSHQNIVRIHDIGEELGRKYISMEYVEGTDLKRIIRAKGKLLPKETIHYAMEIARAPATHIVWESCIVTLNPQIS